MNAGAVTERFVVRRRKVGKRCMMDLEALRRGGVDDVLETRLGSRLADGGRRGEEGGVLIAGDRGTGEG